MKPIVVSYDDIYDGNVKFSEFERIKEEIPNFKVTFFVIMYDNVTPEFIKKYKNLG